MKKYSILLVVILIAFNSCKEIDCCVSPPFINLKFTHNWNGIPITNEDFSALKFTNENGEKLSIEKLRYLISNINLMDSKNYTLVDVGENTGTEISILDVKNGTYNLSFRFGFANEDNKDGEYQFLNSVNFNVPAMLGGGYHFMQFDGKYIDDNNQEAGFNYHTIRAVDRTNLTDLKFEDTSFEVNLGKVEIKNNTEIEIKVNIAEWFKNPNLWNLNELNTNLMGNFEAQKMMNANGKSVFSLGKVVNK
ncbi:hypothetical protein JL193_09995 [Polaribacter batillariae]|uniref:Copper-binding protein MbnP-like domain-containing protein n=1 Tax=Polaribacter batillariae TaxID=2808900 RepID=A0ABX7SS46_9FLAO|nr:MbnP family protein [Polaribacter batillariae]QTD36484.1 hypothetical protein JL193_09995 [Polaribacter batillariae]